METPVGPQKPVPRDLRSTLRNLVGPFVGLAVVVAVGRLAGSHWPAIETWIANLGAWGYAAYCATWIVLSSVCFPVSVLGISSGALFGLRLGPFLVFVSANLAALVMFVLGKGLLRGRIREFTATRPRLAAIDRLAGAKALWLTPNTVSVYQVAWMER